MIPPRRCSLLRRNRKLALVLLIVALAGIITYESLQPSQSILIETPGGRDDFVQLLGLSNAGEVLLSTRNDQGTTFFLWTKQQGLQKIDFPSELNSNLKLSKAGQITGLSDPEKLTEETYQGGPTTFIWNKTEDLREIGPLGRDGHVCDINEAGQVAGSYDHKKHQSGAFLWTKEHGLQDLGTLGGDASFAYGINELGQIVGGADTKALDPNIYYTLPPYSMEMTISGNTDGESHAFLWTKEQGMQNLGTLGGKKSSALDINDSGQVVGCAETETGKSHAFLWTQEQGMVDLGTLGEATSAASAINHAGQVIGSSETKTGEPHAFLWTQKQGMQDLGTLGGGKVFPKAINHTGQIVGTSQVKNGNYQAFLWTQGQGMRPLHDFGGTGSEAEFINDAGQIVGKIDFDLPWWVKVWAWGSKKFDLPSHYKPDVNRYNRSRIAYWEV